MKHKIKIQTIQNTNIYSLSVFSYNGSQWDPILFVRSAFFISFYVFGRNKVKQIWNSLCCKWDKM